jgi:hypothetical protein
VYIKYIKYSTYIYANYIVCIVSLLKYTPLGILSITTYTPLVIVVVSVTADCVKQHRMRAGPEAFEQAEDQAEYDGC